MGNNKDGSGEIAIKMVHTDSTWTMISDIVRLIFSICLLLFSVVSVVYAISVVATTMPFPSWAQFVCLGISLFILGVLEGLQIAVVELAHKDPSQYARVYPRAASLLAFENSGRNVERFLMGRQVLVVFTVFIAARITTFDVFWEDVPQTMIHSLMFSGFLGVILVVVVAQLTPQVLAAAYPVEFLNLPGMPIAFWACLLVEATGIVHAVWFLCVIVRKLVYKCLCGAHETRRQMQQSTKTSKETDYNKRKNTQSIKSNSALSPPTSPRTCDDIDINVTNNMVNTANDVEDKVEKGIEMTNINNINNINKAFVVDRYHETFNIDNEHYIDNELTSLINNIGNTDKRDLFYIYGDGKFMSPSQCYDKFKKTQLCPPKFLLAPDHKDHIPPHIVAMTLLKMYTKLTKKTTL